jgi:hypothetical protein
MRKSRIALGLVVVACAFGVVAAPALAFGKFYASIKGQTLSETEPGEVRGHGEVELLKLAQYTIECPKGIRAKSKVVSDEPQESFFTEVRFQGCKTKSPGSGGFREPKPVNFTLGMEFLSNFSAKVGEGEGDEVRIKELSGVSFKAGGSTCVVNIPAQSIPLKQKAGVEYEAALPETEEELQEKRSGIEKYGEYRKWLNFTIDLKKIRTKVEPNSRCVYEGSEGKLKEGYVEYTNGAFEGDLEEVKLKGGNLWFEEE